MLLITPEEIRAIRVVEILERIGSRESKTLLAEYARGDKEAVLTRESMTALKRIK